MKRRLTRRDMKRDEVREGLAAFFSYLQAHLRAILWGVAGLVAAVLVAVGAYAYMQHEQERANEALAEAMRVYAGTGEAGDPATTAASDDASRLRRARDLFEEVRSRYPLTEAADVVQLYLGAIAAEEGRLDEAREFWRAFLEDHGSHALGAEAWLNVIRLDRQQGRAENVVGALRGMLSDAEKPIPEDTVLYELALTLDQLERSEEAIETYQRLVDEFPGSPYAAPAQRRLAREQDNTRARSPRSG